MWKSIKNSSIFSFLIPANFLVTLHFYDGKMYTTSNRNFHPFLLHETQYLHIYNNQTTGEKQASTFLGCAEMRKGKKHRKQLKLNSALLCLLIILCIKKGGNSQTSLYRPHQNPLIVSLHVADLLWDTTREKSSSRSFVWEKICLNLCLSCKWNSLRLFLVLFSFMWVLGNCF